MLRLVCAFMSFTCATVFAQVPDHSGATESEKVKVALALSKAKVLSTPFAVQVAKAPAPRTLVTDWAQARDESLRDGKPVVVYVGCPAVKRTVGAHELSVAELGDYKTGTAVVFYPVGGRMYAETAIPCHESSTGDEIDIAVERATKKAKAAQPKKLNWS